jgi:hypothetical protein
VTNDESVQVLGKITFTAEKRIIITKRKAEHHESYSCFKRDNKTEIHPLFECELNKVS